MPLTARVREPAVTLSGSWRFRTDPTDQGVSDEWYAPDADWSDDRTVSVPHSWQELDDCREYTGVAWYRRTFDFDGIDPDERAFLTFGAVDYETTVWVNGDRVGQHTDGYLPFALDATDAVTAGENTVTLRVFDPADISEIPHGKQGEPWYTRVSGPWQRIDLVTVPDTYVEDVRVTPDLSDDTASISVSTAHATDEFDVVARIARDDTIVAEATTSLSDGDATVTVDIPDADYWSPANPVLYHVDVTLTDDGDVVDTYADSFGMRSISHDGGQLYLNGEPFTMRGALDQAFYPETFYRPRDLATFEDEIRAAKDLGLNLLRKHIKPAHPAFLDLADRLGILVWEEPANPTVYSERSKREFKAQLQGLVERDYNRPSVVAWSIYNEEWGIGNPQGLAEEPSLWEDEEKQDYLESLYHETRSWDDTRLVCDNSGWAHVATDINDYHEYFVAPDRLDAWRDRLDHIVDHPDANYGDVRTSTDVPLVVSEFGTWGLAAVSSLTDHYGGDPHWFDHDFLSSMKRPAGVQERFATSPTADVFSSLDELATAWQTREFQSVEPIIADMREHEGVAGYVITELTDIEWEFNGLLDYLRQEKAFHDDFARLNAPVMLHLDLDSHSVWGGDELTADIVVANDTNEPVATTVEWTAFGATGTLTIDVGPNEAVRHEAAVAVDAPTVDAFTGAELTATMHDPQWTVTRDVYVAPRTGHQETPVVFAEHDSLAAALDANGYETVDTPAAADVALVTDLDAYDTQNLFLIPDETGALGDPSGIASTELPRDESWNLCACLVYQDLLSEIDPVPGWAFEDLYPYGYLTDIHPNDTVAVGYTEGWLENSGAIAFTRDTDDTDLVGGCTLRVTDAYGSHPVATEVLDRLITTVVRAGTNVTGDETDTAVTQD